MHGTWQERGSKYSIMKMELYFEVALQILKGMISGCSVNFLPKALFAYLAAKSTEIVFKYSNDFFVHLEYGIRM